MVLLLYYVRTITTTKRNKMTDLEKCANFTFDGDQVTFACKLGLWSVSGHIRQAFCLNDEALHYFNQYKKDGEYKKLLS